jgi:hypothetical protein
MITNHEHPTSERIGDRDAPTSGADWTTGPAPPVAPHWATSKLSWLARSLMKLAGVDLALAEEMPADEQQEMERVGLALVFGVMFQAICVFTALTVAFGNQDWIPFTTFVVCGVLIAFDLKFVAGDWEAQGAALSQSRGLMPNGDAWQVCKRPLAVLVRWTMSAFLAWTVAVFVLLKVYGPDIEDHWAENNRAENAPIAVAVGAQHEALVADLIQRITQSDERLVRLNLERAQISAAPPSTADIDRQISDRLDHIRKMEAAKAEAERSAAEYRADVHAEKEGIRLRAGNSGRAGQGPYYSFDAAMAADQDQIARARAADIDADQKSIAELRRQRAAIIDRNGADNRMELEAIEHRIADETAARSALSTERKQLADDREEWIDAHVRAAPGYVPMPHGIVAKLHALADIVSGSALIAGLAFTLKITVMLLESAGPVAKVFFTRAGIYGVLVALRLHDTIEIEADRRVRWEHWRLLNRNRSDEAMDAVRASRRRRETANSARNAVQKIVERFSSTQ